MCQMSTQNQEIIFWIYDKVICCGIRLYAADYRGPQGFWGSGENGYLFSGSWGALVII